MQLATVRQEFANWLQEVQAFLSAIKNQETALGTTASNELNTQKGLLLVLLYGAFEYSITRTVTETSGLINIRRVKLEHVHNLLYPLALDPELERIPVMWKRSLHVGSNWHILAD